MAVYVVQEQNRIDYSDAERFGDVKFLTAIEYNGMRNSVRNSQALADIRSGLAGFDPSLDYLLLTGNPIAIGYAFHIAMVNAHNLKADKLNVLQWEREKGQYKHVVFQR